MHGPIAHLNLDRIFCLKNSRVLQNDFTISYQKRILQLDNQQQAIVRPKKIITIHEKLDGSLELFIRAIRLNFTEPKQRPTKPKEDIIVKDRNLLPIIRA